MLRFGSLHGRLRSARPEYLEAMTLVFGVGLGPLSEEQEASRQFDLEIVPGPSAPAGPDAAPIRDLLTLGGTPQAPTIATDALRAELRLDRQPVEITITVLRNDPSFSLAAHFVVVIHKILFHLDRVVLHAAAVELDGRVSVFVGHKGSGKSTTCLGLAKAGGTVLGEDQVVLRRSAAGYLVSGGDERSRLTERTERHFFAEPLAVPARDFAGTMKKEIRMGEYFRSAPFRDFRPDRLIFPSVTGRFELKPLTAQQALRRLMGFNSHFQRFASGRDQAAYLDLLAGFVAGVSCWELSLSDDLAELDRLADRLRSA